MSGQVFVIERPICDNRGGPGGAGNTIPSLTHPLESGEGGLAMEATRICSVEGCDKPHYARGYCRNHRAQALRSGEITPRPPAGECSIDGCEQPAKSRGWCKLHYSRWAKTGDVTRGKRPKREGCEVGGCDRPHAARGLCAMHAKRAKNPEMKHRTHYDSCQVDGCEKPNNGSQYCRMHYTRMWRNGTLDARPLLDRYAHDGGYSVVLRHGHALADKRGRVYEHRAVLFDAIGPGSHPCNWCGTELSWEVKRGQGALMVDHLDGDRSNNDRANLVPSCDPCNVARSDRWVNQTCGGCGKSLTMAERIARVRLRWWCEPCTLRVGDS